MAESILVIPLEGRLDSFTAPAIRQEIERLRAAQEHEALVFEAKHLTYISSTGLRVIMQAIKAEQAQKHAPVSIIEARKEVYEILEMTGLTELIKVEKSYREISLEGSRLIGKGFYGQVFQIDEDTVVKLFTDTLDNSKQKELMAAFWDEDIEGATDKLNAFLWDTISFMDYHEDYYHAFLVGLFVGLGYAVDSNKESGLGRFDVLVKDRRNRRVLLIEAKKSATQEGMGADCDEALRQIEERGYVRRLDPGYEKAVCYGIAFFRKSAMIKNRIPRRNRNLSVD